jgi:hypothetical protein
VPLTGPFEGPTAFRDHNMRWQHRKSLAGKVSHRYLKEFGGELSLMRSDVPNGARGGGSLASEKKSLRKTERPELLQNPVLEFD